MHVTDAHTSEFDIKAAIRLVVDGGSLSIDQANRAMNVIMDGEATPAQIAALITALRMRGETFEEIAGFVGAMRSHALRVTLPDGLVVVDTCGTGGDHSGTFNISTTAAFVIAGAGIAVAKHGNRSVTSGCGSADVLEALGVTIELSPAQVAESIGEAGIGFMFAPLFHPGFRHAGPTRKEIGIRTVFNMIGPMTNPAGVRRQIIGVADGSVAEKLATAQDALGSERVLFVHSSEGLDELGLGGSSTVTEYDRAAGGVRIYEISPGDVGLPGAPVESLRGGDVDVNTSITRSVLRGELGPKRDVVLFNAGAGIYAAGQADTIREGVATAANSIDSGAAMRALEHLILVTSPSSATAANA